MIFFGHASGQRRVDHTTAALTGSAAAPLMTDGKITCVDWIALSGNGPWADDRCGARAVVEVASNEGLLRVDTVEKRQGYWL
jgi:hypothetical protein